MRRLMRWNTLMIVILLGALSIWGIVYTSNADNKQDSQQTAVSTGNQGVLQELDVIILDSQGYRKDRRGPVKFSHLKHAKDYQIFCWECHHDYKDGENVWSPWTDNNKCDQCHDPAQKLDNVANLQRAYHLNCKVCHEDLAKQNKKSGDYKKCLGCHEKQ